MEKNKSVFTYGNIVTLEDYALTYFRDVDLLSEQEVLLGELNKKVVMGSLSLKDVSHLLDIVKDTYNEKGDEEALSLYDRLLCSCLDLNEKEICEKNIEALKKEIKNLLEKKISFYNFEESVLGLKPLLMVDKDGDLFSLRTGSSTKEYNLSTLEKLFLVEVASTQNLLVPQIELKERKLLDEETLTNGLIYSIRKKDEKRFIDVQTNVKTIEQVRQESLSDMNYLLSRINIIENTGIDPDIKRERYIILLAILLIIKFKYGYNNSNSSIITIIILMVVTWIIMYFFLRSGEIVTTQAEYLRQNWGYYITRLAFLLIQINACIYYLGGNEENQ